MTFKNGHFAKFTNFGPLLCKNMSDVRDEIWHTHSWLVWLPVREISSQTSDMFLHSKGPKLVNLLISQTSIVPKPFHLAT